MALDSGGNYVESTKHLYQDDISTC
jgi:hypothetical protein